MTRRRMRVRLYRPPPPWLPAAAILYFHGGGWTIGSLEAYDLPCRFFCARTGCALVAVDYRLAPEHKFPAAIDDAVAAFRWLAAEAIAFGIDAARIVIAGDSAGGTIAAVAARLLRDDARPPCLQWLIYPATDLAMRSPSYKSCGEGFLLTHAGMTWFRGHYLKDLSETDDPRASPLHANDLSAWRRPGPTNGIGPLRDEGRACAMGWRQQV